MHDHLLDEGATPDLVAEMRALVDETQRAIAASQAILDLCAARPGDGPIPAVAECDGDGSTALGGISDGLLHAYRFAKQDGDPIIVTLVEKALFHVGQRFARGLSVTDVGLSCH